MISSDIFLWTDDLNVHIQEVDEQHKGLAELINQLHFAISENHAAETTREILDQLAEGARTHFLLEESLMRLTHYSGFEVHKHQHELLMEDMRTVQAALDEGRVTLDVVLLHVLKKWLTDHIESCDRHFSAHFKKSGFGQYATRNQETERAMQKRPAWWKFW